MRGAVALAVCGSLCLASCAPALSPNRYTAAQVGSINRAVRGEIVSARPVSVDRSTGTGGTAGAGIGAAVGTSFGSNAEGAIAGAIVGAVVGEITGAATERGVSKTRANEYVIRTDNGALLTLVQGDPEIYVGARVIVLYGSPARIILEPEAMR